MWTTHRWGPDRGPQQASRGGAATHLDPQLADDAAHPEPAASLTELLGAFRPCFTAPTFQTFTALCAGLLAQPGPGTVTGMLTGARLAGVWHHSRAHRFFTKARWNPDQLGLRLAELLTTQLIPPNTPLLVAVDDTLWHRSSRRLPHAAWHHDPSAPAGRRIGWGHCWVVLGLLVGLPWVPHRQICLPILARLWQPKDAEHTKLVLAHQLVRRLATRFPERTIHLVGDAAYAGHSPIGLPEQVTMTSRLRRDACLHALPPARSARPSPQQRRPAPSTGDPGRPARHLLAASHPHPLRQASHRAPDQPDLPMVSGPPRARPVQVILVREHATTRGFDLVLISTDLAATPTQLVERYAARWGIETTFLEARHLLGVGQARNRTPIAVTRTVPFGLLAFTILHLWYATSGQLARDLAHRRMLAPWYRHKRAPATLDLLAAFRRALLAEYSHGHSAQLTSDLLVDPMVACGPTTT